MRCTITVSMKRTGYSKNRLVSICEKLDEQCSDGIPVRVIEAIIREQENYVSFREFAQKPRGDRYDGSRKARKHLCEHLELNEFFGIVVIDPADLLIGEEHDYVFFSKEDATFVETKLQSYFRYFGMTTEEKLDQLLGEAGNAEMKSLVREFVEAEFVEKDLTPAVLEFVELALRLPATSKITNEVIQELLPTIQTVLARELLLRFLDCVRRKVPAVKYSKIKPQKKESRPVEAYSDDVYLGLARCLFNAEYIYEHRMIEKALNNHLYIEMWLFLSLFYCCGERAADMCRIWPYLNLRNKPDNQFGINMETLYDDILNDRIPDEVYEQVCQYAVGVIELSGQMPSKTAGPKTPVMVLAVDSALAPFFGLLTLIAEAVMIRTGEGYMKAGRESQYQKRYHYEAFFGAEMTRILSGRNIQSRRLNKCYLQGLEETARNSGCGSLMSSAIASFARSHKNLDSIAHYLRDHEMNAENAEMVLYFAFERGVFGHEVYQTLLTAYSDGFRELPMKKQNEIMVAAAVSPLEIEVDQSGQLVKMILQDAFVAGENSKTYGILKSMFEISQGRGKGKDEGIHCSLRACGKPCLHPGYDSCLANACPYLVFTRFGYRALLEVLRDYKQEADNGNVKMAAILKTVLMPQFIEIVNQLMKEMNMTRQDRFALKSMLEEVLR